MSERGLGLLTTILEQIQLPVPLPYWEDGEAEEPKPMGSTVVVIDLVEREEEPDAQAKRLFEVRKVQDLL